MKNLFAIFLFCFICILRYSGYTQNRLCENYKWEKNRTLTPLKEEQAKADAIIIKDLRILNYMHDIERYPSKIRLFCIWHKIIRVNTEAAIERTNKVLVPMDGAAEVIEIKARTIHEGGKIVEINQDNIKEVKNAGDNIDYKIFAIEGVDKNCEIEYIVKIKRDISSVGREYFKSDYDTEEAKFIIYTPDHFQIDYKGYNGFPSFKKSADDEGDFLATESFKVVKLLDEPYSNLWNNAMRLEYRLSNLNNYYEITWNSIAKQVCSELYEEGTNLKVLDQELERIKIPTDADTPTRIKLIEQYIKANYTLKKNVEYNEHSIRAIVKNKYCTEKNMRKLYVALFDRLNIAYQIAITSNRNKIAFDTTFSTWTTVDNTLFYFEESNTYLSPSFLQYRYPMIPATLRNNQCIYVTVKNINGNADVKVENGFITALDYKDNYDNINVAVTLHLETQEAILQIEESYGGERAMRMQPYMESMDETQRQKTIEWVLKKASKDGTLTDVRVKNIDPNTSPLERPLIFNGELRSTSLLNKAGDKYTLSIGRLIGEQSQLYDTSALRKLPIESNYPHHYIRHIDVLIPEGYTIKNPEAMNMYEAFAFDKDSAACYFKSAYEQKENHLIVTIEEYYKGQKYPASAFEEYRKVVNAAADFNHRTLLLSK
ncbi:MAG TPA: DUF3857 domain-containing protein [Cytophagaceae bacterium]|jgi:hypothetical protein|nr:DUF3857 domain-containing protein [Cytophagaceae bacterium]